ncbi:hypothetical protein EV426DRAFT_597552 [Tirmania nivea]|nr:hypothetical protein EV426DRAFT_597552 [Tirmania nivea]
MTIKLQCLRREGGVYSSLLFFGGSGLRLQGAIARLLSISCSTLHFRLPGLSFYLRGGFFCFILYVLCFGLCGLFRS